MALPAELQALKLRLQNLGLDRTEAQDRLFAELRTVDSVVLRKSIEEATFGADTRMLGPGNGCPCCGRG